MIRPLVALAQAAAIALGLLACVAPAWAAPAFAQAVTCVVNGSSVTSVSFGAGPANGTVVAILGYSFTDLSIQTATVTDSNSVTLTNENTQAATGSHAQLGTLWDYTASGSPGTTYSGVTGGNAICGYNMSGVALPATYEAVMNDSASGSIAVTDTGTKAGDLLTCFGAAVGSGNGAEEVSSISSNNGSLTVDPPDFTSQGSIFAHGTATSTTSTTITLAMNGSAVRSFLICADYTTPGSSSAPPSLFPYPPAFQPAYAPHGDPIFELLLGFVFLGGTVTRS